MNAMMLPAGTCFSGPVPAPVHLTVRVWAIMCRQDESRYADNYDSVGSELAGPALDLAGPKLFETVAVRGKQKVNASCCFVAAGRT